MISVKIKKIRPGAVTPVYGSEFAAGADLYACLEADAAIAPHETLMIPTGICMEIPAGYAGFVHARSSVASKRGLAPANKVGVIDCDYRGELIVALHNHSDEPQTVGKNERIAQLVIAPYIKADVEETDELTDTERGAGGFGSTGKY